MVKFLIIRFSSIGDIVLTTPVIRGLKLQVADSEIHFLTKPAFSEILEANPNLSKIHILSDEPGVTIKALQEESFDFIIDLQNNLRSRSIKQSLKRMYFTVNKVNVKKWLYVNLKIDKLPDLHIVDRYLKTVDVFDVKKDEFGLDYYLKEADNIKLADLPPPFSEGYITMVIGAKHNTKKLPITHLTEIASKIEAPLILIGGPEDKDDGEKIKNALPAKTIFNACGSWSINQSASIIKQSNCVITHDTGMMHIAAAFNKKIITVWGNTTPRFGMYPYMPSIESLNFEVKGLSCRPCSKLGKTSCPKKHFHCMTNHDPGEIALAANTMF